LRLKYINNIWFLLTIEIDNHWQIYTEHKNEMEKFQVQLGNKEMILLKIIFH